jgi:hypothetical protein
VGITSKIKRAIKNPNKTIKGTYSKIDQNAGKKLFGNTVGLKHNLHGTLNKANVGDSVKSNDPQIMQFQKNGYISLGVKYDEKLVESIKQKYDKMIENDKFSFGSGIDKEKIFKRQIIDPHINIPEVESILTEEMIDMIKGYYGGNFHVVRVDLWRTYHIPKELQENDLISNRWHCDNRKTDRLKLFVNLSDVSENDGPLHLQAIPRTKELMKMNFKNRLDYGVSNQTMEDPNHVIKCTGEKGSAFFANTTTCLHKAGNPDNTRDIIQFLFRSSKEPLDTDWIKRVIHVSPDHIDTVEE